MKLWRCHSLLLVLSLVVTSCATPVGVKQVDTLAAHRLLTASALTSQTPSVPTRQVLNRLGLYEEFQEQPETVLAALHAGLAPVGDVQRLFALAELSFLHAEQTQKDCAASKRRYGKRKNRQSPPFSQPPRRRERVRAYYLAAVIYAYALLFPTDQANTVFSPADPRARLTYDLYNRGLAEGLASPDGQEIVLAPGRHRLPFGTLNLTLEAGDLAWEGCQLEHFVPTAKLAVRGLRNRYRVPGIGAPLAASLVCATPTVGSGASRFPPRLKVPVTLFLRLAEPRQNLTHGSLSGRLELYTSDQTQTVWVGGQEQPLEFERTAALAYMLEGAPIYEFELAGFLASALPAFIPQDRAQDGLFVLSPARPDRIPIVLVHGTASSPARWAELINELENDPRLRARYQIWLFLYDTGNPVGYSAGRLREALQHLVDELDPERQAAAPDEYR